MPIGDPPPHRHGLPCAYGWPRAAQQQEAVAVDRGHGTDTRVVGRSGRSRDAGLNNEKQMLATK